ncbi:MAG TPA: hypothetical protein VGD78_14185 [Chthoniobacterales bacterium]
MNPKPPVAAPLPGKFVYRAFSEDLDLTPPRTLDEIVALTPEQMARSSRLVTSAYAELLQVAAGLEDPAYRRLMTECLASPKITFLDLYPTREARQEIFAEMVSLGFFNGADQVDEVFPPNARSLQTYLTAPSSHNDFYNAFPGGLAAPLDGEQATSPSPPYKSARNSSPVALGTKPFCCNQSRLYSRER